MQTDVNFMQARNAKRRNTKAKKNEQDDEFEEQDPDESEDEDPMDYLDLVKSALFNTRRILEDIDENGSLFM